jgi:transcriptional regulator with XRE-family HTH domain
MKTYEGHSAETIGAAVRKLRKSKEMTAKDAAALLGLKDATNYSAFEHGKLFLHSQVMSEIPKKLFGLSSFGDVLKTIAALPDESFDENKFRDALRRQKLAAGKSWDTISRGSQIGNKSLMNFAAGHNALPFSNTVRLVQYFGFDSPDAMIKASATLPESPVRVNSKSVNSKSANGDGGLALSEYWKNVVRPSKKKPDLGR